MSKGSFDCHSWGALLLAVCEAKGAAHTLHLGCSLLSSGTASLGAIVPRIEIAKYLQLKTNTLLNRVYNYYEQYCSCVHSVAIILMYHCQGLEPTSSGGFLLILLVKD